MRKLNLLVSTINQHTGYKNCKRTFTNTCLNISENIWDMFLIFKHFIQHLVHIFENYIYYVT